MGLTEFNLISDCKCNSECEKCGETIYKKIEKGVDAFGDNFYRLTWYCKKCNEELYSTTRKTIE